MQDTSMIQARRLILEDKIEVTRQMILLERQSKHPEQDEPHYNQKVSIHLVGIMYLYKDLFEIPNPNPNQPVSKEIPPMLV